MRHWIAGLAVALAGLAGFQLRVSGQNHVTITGDCTQAGATQPCTVSGFQQADPVSVSVSPQNPTVPSGGAQQFVATVLYAQNTAVLWAATAGSIDIDGLFTAPSVVVDTPVSVTATSVADPSKSSTTVATVKAAAVITVAVSPKTVALLAGAAQQFTASVTGSTNTAVTWTATAGTVDATGLYTAGISAATGTITATSAADPTKSDSATATITALPPASFDGPAELPRVYLDTRSSATPSPGAKINVAAVANLQAAINAANCGDTLLLAAGATWTGVFTLPSKPCDDQHWILIRTDAPDSALPPEGTRITPCYFGVASLPARPPLNCQSTANVGAALMASSPTGPLIVGTGANHYRIGPGIQITRPVGTGANYGLITTSSGGPGDSLYLDRVWLHGTANDESKAGFTLGGMTRSALIDSYTSDFHCISGAGVCTDAQAVVGGNGTHPAGPFRIADNFIEASGEGVLFGGGSASTTAADIEVVRNHFFKPLIWMPGYPGFVGGPAGNPFITKNHLELKNAQRVLVEANIFENVWGGFSQVGFVILLTPKNQGGGCPICTVTDVTIRYNVLSHSGSGIAMATVASDTGAIAAGGERFSIHDITMDDINKTTYNGGGGLFQVVNGQPSGTLNTMLINHITGFSDPNGHIISLGNDTTKPPLYGFTFENSIIGTSKYPIWSSGGLANCAIRNVPLTSLNACFPGGYSYTKNAMIATSYPPSQWPAGNFFPASVPVVQFVDYAGGDYTLLPTSPYANAGTDGKNLGADTVKIKALTAGVR